MHRLWKLLICAAIVAGVAFSQQRYLVTPSQEIYPIGKETGGALGELLRLHPKAPASFCDLSTIYGFDPQIYHPQISFSFHHRDVCGQWYTIPFDATIDTFYFLTGASVGPDCDSIGQPCIDSTVYIRIFTSNITASSGPGVRPGPYHPPCVTWGYWINTNDNDRGISPFRDEATDTTWQPTNLMFGDPDPSFPPMGDLLWGGNGYPVHLSANSLIKVPMADLGPLQVHKGDAIFVAILFPSMAHLALSQEVPLLLLANTDKAPYPSRNWKFYEHDSGMSLACSGIDSSMVRKGWAARGGLTGDSTSTLAYDIWYSFTPTANIPPVILSVQELHTTTSAAPQQVTAQILDCDYEMPSRAGVASAFIAYHLDSDTVWSTAPMSGILDQFTGTLPGIPAFHSMTYRIVATDSAGASDSSATFTYRVVDLNSTGWYRCDTAGTPTPANIASIGTAIDTSAWFVPPRAYLGGKTPHRGDDGTAGPFAISGGFPYYGDTMYYAWVGVNGAIALSKTATDTIDVNANGIFSNQFDIPYSQRHSRQDTSIAVKVPKAFIAPYWADWVVKQDSPLATFGHIRYLDDTSKFVVEWDSVGAFFDVGAQPVIDAFRLVLNKPDHTIEFQYDQIGAAGYDTLNLTGIHCDSNYHPVPNGQFPPFNFFNKHGYPAETHLHNGLNIRYVPVVATVAASDGWNLLSLPAVYENDSVSFLFQSKCSSAFRYTCSGSYEPILAIDPAKGFGLRYAALRPFRSSAVVSRNFRLPSVRVGT